MEKTKRKNLARRERLNPDWPIQILNFRAFPTRELPQELWDSAKLMIQLWGELCEVFERASALDTKDEKNKPTRSKDERRAIWLPLGSRKTVPTEKNAETYALAQTLYGGKVPSLHEIGCSYKGRLPSAYYESVVARFIVTVKEWQKAPNLKGAPKKKHGLDRINLPIVFNEGTTLQELMNGRNASLRYVEHLKGQPEHQAQYRENAHVNVGVAGVAVPLHVAFTRPLEAQAFRANHAKKAIPEAHRIKRVSLIGRRTNNLGWEWWLQIQIEHEPNRTPRQMTGRGCGVDLGWRMREDGLRIAAIADTDGRTMEFVLPFTVATGREVRRNIAKFGDTYEYADWRKMAERKARLDELKDKCKADIKDLPRDNWPDEARQMMSGFHKMGIGGLKRLARLLPEGEPARAIIWEWWDAYQPLARRHYGQEAQLRQLWSDARKQLAAWLCREYDVIAWEGDLKLKDLAEKWTSEYDGALDQARKWRQRASLHEFRQWVKLQAAKQKAELRDGGTAYSTQTCRECGGTIKPGGKLLLVCENGHVEDQDVNAALLFCNGLEWAAGMSQKPLEIPAHLQGYVRRLSETH